MKLLELFLSLSPEAGRAECAEIQGVAIAYSLKTND